MSQSGSLIGMNMNDEEVGLLIEQCQEKDWKRRLDGVTDLSESIISNRSRVSKSKLMQKILDLFCKLFNDTNNKVQLQALNLFHSFSIYILDPITANIHNIYLSIYNALSSNNSQVLQQAQLLINTLTLNLDTIAIIPSLTNSILHALSKAKPFFIQQLICRHILLYPLLYI